MSRAILGWALACVALACTESPSPRASFASKPAAPRNGLELRGEPLHPLPPVGELDARVVALGEKLFHDKRLSADGTVACASCHIVGEGGDDNLPRSKGIGGREGGVNAPTVLNAALNFVLFWDGRAATLEDQAGGPLVNEKEMATTWEQVLRTLRSDPEYAALFKQSFPDGVSEKNVRTSIATFERTLLTPGARFDLWLQGDKSALTEEEAAGYALFKSVGCIACHQGQNVGGNMFQKFGVLGDYFKDRGNITKDDYGRFNVTGLESDRFVFRVPSLRNVELTAPYFHDGSASTLEQAVRTMARYQLGRPLEEEEVARLVAFLKTLTAPLPGKAKR